MMQCWKRLLFWRDRAYLAALLAAPIFWALLFLLDVPTSEDKPALWPYLMIVLVYPVLEEIVFRGGLQSMLLARPVFKKSQCQISLANVVTSILFAAMHLINQPPLSAASVFIPSLIFGWAWERHQTLLSPMLLHVFYNAGFVYLFVST